MTNSRRRSILFFLLLLVGIFVAAGMWLRVQRCQYALDRELIVALQREDTAQALSLVNMGADPNTPSKPLPPPSYRQMWNYVLHRSPLPTNDSSTAFLIACGDVGGDRLPHLWMYHKDAPQLVQGMLQRGAKKNAKDVGGWTPLMWSLWATKPQTTRVLLEHGADATAQDTDGLTVLDVAVLFSAHPGDVMVKNMIPLLLMHGATPNPLARNGAFAVPLAQKYKRPDIAILLRGAGVRK